MYSEFTNWSIKNWAEEDRPREKLLLKGKDSLSDAELLAIIIGSGNKSMSAVALSQYILAECNNDLNLLGNKSVACLTDFSGIGEAKAISIIAALELGRRRQYLPAKTVTQIRNSNDAFVVMQAILSELSHEEFWIITLNNNNRILNKTQLSSGGINSTIVDQRLVFHHAIRDKATSIILVHNHPSGNKMPSEKDIELTRTIRLGGNLLDISLLDHIIVAGNDYYSFKDNGLV